MTGGRGGFTIYTIEVDRVIVKGKNGTEYDDECIDAIRRNMINLAFLPVETKSARREVDSFFIDGVPFVILNVNVIYNDMLGLGISYVKLYE